jgi:hypothetical protein
MSVLKGLSYFLFALLLLQGMPLHAANEEGTTSDEIESEELAPPNEDPAIHAIVPQKNEPPPKIVAPTMKQHFDEYSIAVLQELDKMNARVQTIEVPIGKPVPFGVLEVEVKACRKTPPEDQPESAAFIEIRDTRYKEKSLEVLFKGWMFASSPALSALENPNYDVWVLDCKNPATKERSAVKPSSTPKKAAPDKAAPKAE